MLIKINSTDYTVNQYNYLREILDVRTPTYNRKKYFLLLLFDVKTQELQTIQGAIIQNKRWSFYFS